MRTFFCLAFVWILLVLAVMQSASALPYEFVARGDMIYSEQDSPQGTCWYFPETGIGTIYDKSSEYFNERTWCSLSKEQTRDLKPGYYTLLYEEPVYRNGKYFKDVSWVNETLVSAFTGAKPIPESGREGPMVLRDLKRIISENGFNNYTTSEILIQEPEIRIIEMGQTADNVYTVRGTSNLANNTPITIKIDETRYYAQHNDSFTYHTKVIRESFSSSGMWVKAMNMPIQDMPPGWHNITIYARDLITEARFKVEEREWKPGPTPTQYVKYLSDGNIAPVIVTVTVLQTPIIIYQDKWHTATPTPVITDALGDGVNYPYEPGESIPGWVGIGCLVLIGTLTLLRGWKWK